MADIFPLSGDLGKATEAADAAALPRYLAQRRARKLFFDRQAVQSLAALNGLAAPTASAPLAPVAARRGGGLQKCSPAGSGS